MRKNTLPLALSLALAAGCWRGDENALSVIISLPGQLVPLAARATLIVDYAGTGARLLSEGGGPACAFMLPGVDGEFSDDSRGTLTIHANGSRATRGPADIAACRMQASDATATAADLASRLTVRVEAAVDAAGKSIDLAAVGAISDGDGDDKSAARPSDDEIEKAQAKAVAAAAAITNAARAADANAVPTVPADSGRTRSATNEPAGTPAASRAAAPADSRPQTAGSSATPNLATVPVGSAPAVVDNSAMPSGDRDPGYDDSPADDDTAPSYSLDFYVQTPGNYGALQLEITHLGRSGGFIGRDGDVDCKSLVDGALDASNYLGERLTKIGLIHTDGIQTPANVIRCGFRTHETLSPGSFLINVVDAADTDSNPIEPPPAVVIASIVPRR